MNTSSESAEQIVRIYLEGVEVALKLSGSGAKNIAAALYAISKDQTKIKGKTRIVNLLKSGKELKVFSIKKEDLKKFSEEAKKYGVLYSAIINKKIKDEDGLIDIMVKSEDASKVNRIVERFKLGSVDTVSIKKEIEQSLEDKKKNDFKEENNKGVQEIGAEEKVKKDELIKPIQKEKNTLDKSSVSKTQKKTPLENSLESKKHSDLDSRTMKKPSVREELKSIKEELEHNKKNNSKNRTTIHKHPQKKKKFQKEK